jgi:hypothetical protein
MHHLHSRSEVQCVVQRAIAGTTQPMAAYVTAGRFNRSGSCVARVMARRGETRDIPSVAKDLSREQLANSGDPRQGAAAGRGGLCASLPVGGEIAVQSSHVTDELSGPALALDLDNGDRANGPEERGRIVGCEVGRRTTWGQVSEQPVEPVDRPPALLVQFVPPVGEEPQDRRMVLTRYLAKSSAGMATVATTASRRSVFRLWPVCRSRARPARLAGTSTTVSPALTSCCARKSPSPVAPSMAHVRSGHAADQFSRRLSVALFAGTRSCAMTSASFPTAAAVCEPVCGSIPMMTTICTPSLRLRRVGHCEGHPELQEASRLYRATPQSEDARPARMRESHRGGQGA